MKIRNFYYSNTVSLSVDEEVKKDTSLVKDDRILFYYMWEDNLIESIFMPLGLLLEAEEVWVSRINIRYPEEELYVSDIFESYSYFLREPF